MPWLPGTHVWLKALKKEGLVIEKGSQGVYTVSVGTVSFRCRENELENAPSIKPEIKSHSRMSSPAKSRRSLQPAHARSVDLHGYTVEDAMRVLEQALSDAIMSGCDRLEILHGLGTGKVMRATHRLLRSSSIVRSFKHELNNPGVTIAYFG